MVYVACEVVDGTAHVAAKGEIAEVAWCDRSALAAKVPDPFQGPAKTTSTLAFADVVRTAVGRVPAIFPWRAVETRMQSDSAD
jgi:hypothetical protein